MTMRMDLNGGESEARGVVARFFTALRFVLNDGEEGFRWRATDERPPTKDSRWKCKNLECDS